jgi:hypothetical protein
MGTVGPHAVSGEALEPRGARARLIRVASRAGVWGFVLALVPPLGEAFGVWVEPSLTGPISSVGLVVSGLGTCVASVLVWRSLPAKPSPLKIAAGLGVPFGSALTVAGAALLRPLSPLADFVNVAGPFVLALAVAVVTLLIVGFLSVRPNEGDHESRWSEGRVPPPEGTNTLTGEDG